ncbi:ureidoglycolate lyase [Phormidium sp. CLA17]|uniref:ureidoglycolate lyase n=1 Tax=Leptolyngbya sp. Cla-17 TaxID=2803751 RepID=UPI0014926852|nr:ureidoglycolate lyase [Leptolyngbya sp. Cla-17]MBM0742985.1 ureidoglycolate lyase [Leptolyngbya sp. Cla-17]
METYLLLKLRSQLITPEAFQPFGQVIFSVQDDQPYGDRDAQLQLQNGIPRFYIMRQHNRGLKFNSITRHQRCTQCLGSLEGKEWFMAVAPPRGTVAPQWEDLTAFRIPGNCFIKLHLGTWHAGPYFEQSTIDFYSLELSDTNEVDHESCNLLETYGVEFEIVPNSIQGVFAE